MERVVSQRYSSPTLTNQPHAEPYVPYDPPQFQHDQAWHPYDPEEPEHHFPDFSRDEYRQRPRVSFSNVHHGRPSSSFVLSRPDYDALTHRRGSNSRGMGLEEYAGRGSFSVLAGRSQPSPSFRVVGAGGHGASFRLGGPAGTISYRLPSPAHHDSATAHSVRPRFLENHLAGTSELFEPRLERGSTFHQRLRYLADSRFRLLELDVLHHLCKAALKRQSSGQKSVLPVPSLLELRLRIQKGQLILRHVQAVVEAGPTFRSLGDFQDPKFVELGIDFRKLLGRVEDRMRQNQLSVEADVPVPPELKAMISESGWAELRGVDHSRPRWEQEREVEDNSRRVRKSKSFYARQHPYEYSQR